MQRRPLQLKTYLTAVTKRELEKIFRLVWDLNRLPSAILGAALTSVESEAQELRNSFCFLVFVIVVVMVAYIKLRSIVKHHDRQVLSILSNDWFSWFLLKAGHSWVLNYDIRWSANFFLYYFRFLSSWSFLSYPPCWVWKSLAITPTPALLIGVFIWAPVITWSSLQSLVSSPLWRSSQGSAHCTLVTCSVAT